MGFDLGRVYHPPIFIDAIKYYSKLRIVLCNLVECSKIERSGAQYSLAKGRI